MVNSDAESVRLDIWLDVACLFRTRSEAQRAAKGGKIDINGQAARPNRLVRVGDEIVIGRPFGRKQRVVVKAIAVRHIPRTEARALYDDRTPPSTPEETEQRRLERLFRAKLSPPRAPDKRQRRELRRLKGKD